jgi:two-component system phosphate regulon response regulator PhoB
MATRVLYVEDEADLARTVAWQLEREGYTVVHAATGRQGLELALQDPPFDVLLLDLMLPDVSGTEICRQVRAHPRTKDMLVLMLTARGEEIDRVVGFEVGADDYLVKPFSVRELALRLKALLRRSQAGATGEGILAAGPLRLDLEGHCCWVDGEAVALTAIEFKLLTSLVKRRGRVQTRSTLLDQVWGHDTDVAERTVDASVKRLREKLGAAGTLVETLRGVGYRFTDEATGS